MNLKTTTLTALITISLMSTTHASMRSMYKDKADLFLHEKVGKIENMLDNPAQLIRVDAITIEDNVDLAIADSKPFDPVYDKTSLNEVVFNSFQAVVPINEMICLRAGYSYLSSVQGSESTSSIDDSIINDVDKSFSRTTQASLATSKIPLFDFGYSFAMLDQPNFDDFASDIASDYTYFNDHQGMQHIIGIIKDGFEVYGGMSMLTYAGSYNNVQEIDFELSAMELNARKVFELSEQSNVLVQVGFETSTLTQNTFVLGRDGYDLDVPSMQVSGGAYYYLPQETLDLAFGIEGAFQQHDFFDVGDYVWTSYEDMQVSLPAQLNAQLLPWLRVWVELQIAFEQNTYIGSQTIALRNAVGVQVDVAMVELQLYTLPTATLTTSDKSDDVQGIEVGLTATARF
jgi:hypothetical protein